MVRRAARRRITHLAWTVAAFVLLAAAPAHAYVDPGSGTMLWQLILATGAGALLAGRRALARLFGLLRAGLRRER
ncbi:MAG: hypothetical protein QN135_02425 [Armatimonadota bacterium]|nr:hypothetical protein [Armatimonadota bacterium]